MILTNGDEYVINELTPTSPARRTIVVSLDGSPESDYALHMAALYFFSNNDQVILFNVRNPAYDPSLFIMSSGEESPFIFEPPHLDELNQALRLESFGILKRAAKKLHEITQRQDIHVQVKAISLCGPSTRSELVEKINHLKPDMVLVGARGSRSAISSFLLGSVSNYILHHAHCPVMILRKPQSADKKDNQLMNPDPLDELPTLC